MWIIELERIEADPRISLAYHAREHGRSELPQYVLVEGRAEPDPEPSQARRDDVRDRATDVLGEPKSGFFWDRWMHEYYVTRIPVDVQVERVLVWADLSCSGEPEVLGAPLPGPPEPQKPPGKGTGPRVDVQKAASKLKYNVNKTAGPTSFPADRVKPGVCGTLVTANGTGYDVTVPFFCGKAVKSS